MPSPRLKLFTFSLLLSAGLVLPLSAQPTDDDLYRSFEALNTPQNLALRFVGGKPLKFIEEQLPILSQLASRNTPEASRLLLRITDEYLARVDKLGPGGFRVSPLQALQLPLVQVLAPRASQPDFRTRLQSFATSKVIKDYARARALFPLTEQKLRALDHAKDPDGSKRGAIILTEMLGDLSFSDCVHAPVRLTGVSRLTATVVGPTPSLVWQALASADSVTHRYARDFAFAAACAAPADGAPRLLQPHEIIRLKDIIDRWLKEYRPLLANEKYPTDVLGSTLRSLAAAKGAEELAHLMPPPDPAPAPPPPDPKP